MINPNVAITSTEQARVVCFICILTNLLAKLDAEQPWKRYSITFGALCNFGTRPACVLAVARRALVRDEGVSALGHKPTYTMGLVNDLIGGDPQG